jgi:hypothetical protein
MFVGKNIFMDTVTLEKKERRPLAIKRVELKIRAATQPAASKATEGKATEEVYNRPNYLLRLL